MFRWPIKTQLNEGVVALHKELQDLARVHTRFGIAVALEDDVELGDDAKSMRAIFETGRNALSAIAAVNCLVNMKGKDQIATATKLWANKQRLPESLAALIEKVKE